MKISFNWRIFFLKYYFLKKNKWIATLIVEIIIPIIVLYGIYFTCKDVKQYFTETQYFPPRKLNIESGDFDDTQILYCPKNQITNNILERLCDYLNVNYSNMRGFDNEKEILNVYNTMTLLMEDYTEVIIIVFFNMSNTTGHTSHLEYKIRIPLPNSDVQYLGETQLSSTSDIDDDFYFVSQFLMIQYLLDLSYIRFISTDYTTPNVTFQPILTPKHCTANLKLYQFKIIEVSFLLTQALVIFPTTSEIVNERLSGKREYLRVMGISKGMNWIVWILYGMMSNLIYLIGVIFVFKKILDHASLFLMFLFFFFSFLASIIMAFTCSNFFNDYKIAVAFSNLPFVIATVVVSLKVNLLNQFWFHLLSYVIPSLTFKKLIFAMVTNECVGGFSTQNLSWHTMSQYSSIGFTGLMYIFNVFFYFAILLYMDRAFPGKYGYAIPWNYLCEPILSFFFKYRNEQDLEGFNEFDMVEEKFKKDVDGTVLVSIRNVYKRHNKFMAIHNLNVEIYEKVISVFLGGFHSGKSTVLAMILGLCKPTSGSVLINGIDATVEIRKIRRHVGMCPQQNVYFPYLTVLQHLIFFSMLKGMSFQDAMDESNRMLIDQDLLEDKNNLPQKLSLLGQRKLSILIAFCGNSKIVVLDEPSSGLDLEGQLDIWDIINDYRSNRTIILGTQEINEAQFLAEDLFILDQGILRSSGSPKTVFNKYGPGYLLRVVISNNVDVVKGITKTVQSMIVGSELMVFTNGVAMYKIHTRNSHQLSQLFAVLESKKKEFKIIGFGLQIQTIECVFLKPPQKKIQDILKERKPYKKVIGIKLCANQMFALFYNAFYFRYHQALKIVVLLLFLAILISCTIQFNLGITQKAERLVSLSLEELYPNSKVFYSATPEAKSIGVKFKNLVKTAKGELNLTKTYMNLAEKDSLALLKDVVIGAKFTKHDITIMFSTFAKHASAISLNKVMNAHIQDITNANYTITTYNQPMNLNWQDSLYLNFAICIIIIYLFIPIPSLSLIYNQNKNGMKRVQVMTGVDLIVYWSINWVFCVCSLMISCGVAIPILEQYDSLKLFHEASDSLMLFRILLVFAFSTTIFNFVLSCFVKNEWQGFAITLILVLIKITLNKYFLFLDILYSRFIENAIPINSLYTILYTLEITISDYNMCTMKHIKKEMCLDEPVIPEIQFCCDMGCSSKCEKNYLGSESPIYNTMKLNITFCILYFIFLVCKENYFCNKFLWFFGYCKPVPALSTDVNEERIYVSHFWNTNGVEGGCTDILLVKNFHKTYNKCFRKSIKSLRGISFGVRNKECFVLLGNVNCGKSSVAHILTNETVPNSGDAKIEGYKLSTQWHRFLRMIGYCPETNALHNTMTVYENLKIIVLLKGIPWSQISEEIDFWLTIAGIQKLKNRFVGELSLGTKRILGTIVALIGDPTLVLLDEPTHSIDPESRSCIWSLLSAFQNSSQSFLITTRSIEECQALCQRCAIIFNGEFKCIGPVGFLSRYYVQGFKINILLNPLTEDSVVMEITDKMHKNFSAVLKERTPCYLRMIILSNDITLSTFFTQMETLKEYFHGVIVEFTVVDASLNEVFSNVNLTNEY